MTHAVSELCRARRSHSTRAAARRATLSSRTMSTDDIFRARLLAKETSLRALSKKYLAFVNSLDSASEEEVQAAHQALTKDLAAYEFAMVKARTLIDTSGRQVGDYVQMSKAIEAEMAHTREDIERLTGQLQQERTVREQKEQYAALARRIKQYPPREQTRQEIEALEGEIAALEEDGKGIASKLELRSKQFAAFMHSVHDLQLSLAEEEQTKAGAMDTS